jgi:hypothetical protein
MRESTLPATRILIFRVFVEPGLHRLLAEALLGGFNAARRQVQKLRIFVVVEMREEGIEPGYGQYGRRSEIASTYWLPCASSRKMRW